MIYPTFSPTKASLQFWSSVGGSRNRTITWGAVWLDRFPSNSCKNNLPVTASVSLNKVLKITVTRSFLASIYLKQVCLNRKKNYKKLQSFFGTKMNHSTSVVSYFTLFQFWLKIEILVKNWGKTVTLQMCGFQSQCIGIIWELREIKR